MTAGEKTIDVLSFKIAVAVAVVVVVVFVVPVATTVTPPALIVVASLLIACDINGSWPRKCKYPKKHANEKMTQKSTVLAIDISFFTGGGV